jgi:hypothetical protein
MLNFLQKQNFMRLMISQGRTWKYIMDAWRTYVLSLEQNLLNGSTALNRYNATNGYQNGIDSVTGVPDISA